MLMIYAFMIRVFFGLFARHHVDVSSWIIIAKIFLQNNALFTGWSYGPLAYVVEVSGYLLYRIINIRNVYLLNLFMKIPYIVGDLLLYYVFNLYLKRFKYQGRSNAIKSFVLILVLLNPLFIHYSAVHGMQESLMMALVFLGIYLFYYKCKKILGLIIMIMSALVKYATAPFLLYVVLNELLYGIRRQRDKMYLVIVSMTSIIIFTIMYLRNVLNIAEFIVRAYELTLLAAPSYISLCGILRSIGLPYKYVPFLIFPILLIPIIVLLKKRQDPFVLLLYTLLALVLFIPNFQLNFLYWIEASLLGLVLHYASIVDDKYEYGTVRYKHNVIKVFAMLILICIPIFQPTVIETFYTGALYPSLFYTNLVEFSNVNINPSPRTGFGYGASIILLMESIFCILSLSMLIDKGLEMSIRRLSKRTNVFESAFISISYIMVLVFICPFLFSRLTPIRVFDSSKLIYIALLISFPLISFYFSVSLWKLSTYYHERYSDEIRIVDKASILLRVVFISIIIVTIVFSIILTCTSFSMSNAKEIHIDELRFSRDMYYKRIILNITAPSIIELEFKLSSTASRYIHIKLCSSNKCKYVQWGVWGWCDDFSDTTFRFQIFNRDLNITSIVFYGGYPPNIVYTVYKDVKIRIYTRETQPPEESALAFWGFKGIPRRDIKIVYYANSINESHYTIRIPKYTLLMLSSEKYPTVLLLTGNVQYPKNKTVNALVLKMNNVIIRKNFYQIYCCRSVEWRGRIWKLYYIYVPPSIIRENNFIVMEFQHKNAKLIPLGLAIILRERS